METNTRLNKETTERLRELIQVNVDSHEGYTEAASNTEDMNVNSLFLELAAQRQQQAAELRTLIASDSDGNDTQGSYAAAAHRAWMDLRAVLGGGTHAMLSEMEKGEDHIKGKYEEILRECPVSAASDVLQRQYRAVTTAHDRVRDLRDTYQS